MKKLLVVLLALLTVATFAAVNFSGTAWAKLEVLVDTTPAATPSISSGGTLSISVSGNESEMTGFSVTFLGNPDFGVASAYVWQYLYKTEPLSVRYRLGTLSRGSALVKNSGGALAFDFGMKAGDLTDNLSLFAYFPSATRVDLDVWNRLTFTFVTATVFAKGLISNLPPSFPNFGLDLTLDLVKAMSISGATKLNAYANLEINPTGSGLGMLPQSKFGVDWAVDVLSGGVWLKNLNTIGANFETTILKPVTLGGSVELPVNVTNFADVKLGAYATWKVELLTHTVSLDFKQPNATIAWTVSASF